MSISGPEMLIYEKAFQVLCPGPSNDHVNTLRNDFIYGKIIAVNKLSINLIF